MSGEPTAAGDLEDLVLAIAVESRPADSSVISLVSVGTPVECHLLPLVTDFGWPPSLLHGEADDERPKVDEERGVSTCGLNFPEGPE